KTNNMTPSAVNGVSTDATQVCWDGTNQILLPAHYDPNCVKYGSVKSISVTDGGSGYTSAPTVAIDAPALIDGIQATAHANMVTVGGGAVQSVIVTAGGSAYDPAPTVTITGDGIGATAIATITPAGSPVNSITLSSPGTACYATTPAVAFTGGSGSGAAATATLASTNSCISGWTVSGTCNAHKNETVTGIGLSGTTGSGFSGTLTFNSSGVVTASSIQTPGSSYSTVPTNITN